MQSKLLLNLSFWKPKSQGMISSLVQLYYRNNGNVKMKGKKIAFPICWCSVCNDSSFIMILVASWWFLFNEHMFFHQFTSLTILGIIVTLISASRFCIELLTLIFIPEILILGCGRNIEPVNPELRRFILSTGMKLEALDSVCLL